MNKEQYRPGQANLQFLLGIARDVEISGFFITQSLHKIIFGESRSAKSAILTHLDALNFAFYEFLHFLNH